MQYLVTAEWVELGALLSPEQVSGIIERTVGPSLEILAQWEEEGKIRGGTFPGERAGTWVFEADSSEELDGMLTTLPFWGQMKWHIRPLQTSRSKLRGQRELGEQLRTAPGPAAQGG
jgi:muconolactone delta-isomerase